MGIIRTPGPTWAPLQYLLPVWIFIHIIICILANLRYFPKDHWSYFYFLYFNLYLYCIQFHLFSDFERANTPSGWFSSHCTTSTIHWRCCAVLFHNSLALLRYCSPPRLARCLHFIHMANNTVFAIRSLNHDYGAYIVMEVNTLEVRQLLY